MTPRSQEKSPVAPQTPGALLEALRTLRGDMLASAARAQARLAAIHADRCAGALNLMHYLALRRHDLRPIQTHLASLGLSSLGRAESNVLANVDAVLRVLHRLEQCAWQAGDPEEPVARFDAGRRHLAAHADALLGPPRTERTVRIMVTLPSEAAEDGQLIRALLEQGMDCMRINCAHDNAAAWARMIAHLREAERQTGRSCRIFMDLAGPKLRTGPLEPGPAVVRARPARDAFGRVIAPARIWLCAAEAPAVPPAPAAASLPVPADWLHRLRAGDRVHLDDARAAHRTLTIADVTDRGCWAETSRTIYFVPGLVLQREAGADAEDEDRCRIGELPPIEAALVLCKGDMLIITRDERPGRPARHDGNRRCLAPATIGCTLPEAFDHVRPGEPIWFDDGRIGGTIEHVDADRVVVRITQEHARPLKLRADKGINLPESRIDLPALTGQDRENLPFVARHADIVGLSFANHPDDVTALQQQLAALGARRPAIVLKIETRRGFEHLPDLLLAAMRAPQCGVMIARGDLAVECGFERLAEVQEEILWLCEAAHVPVIWATQVLETLAKEGRPSRAEISDAAMSLRAECVMLNKGPYILRAVRTLDDILQRMHAHQAKKRSLLRALRLANRPSIDHDRDASPNGRDRTPA
ncbi:MAG: pyruvate kinase [Gammaproteobacteria bacterium]